MNDDEFINKNWPIVLVRPGSGFEEDSSKIGEENASGTLREEDREQFFDTNEMLQNKDINSLLAMADNEDENQLDEKKLDEP